MWISVGAFQRAFTCKSWLRYSRERALSFRKFELSGIRISTLKFWTSYLQPSSSYGAGQKSKRNGPNGFTRFEINHHPSIQWERAVRKKLMEAIMRRSGNFHGFELLHYNCCSASCAASLDTSPPAMYVQRFEACWRSSRANCEDDVAFRNFGHR